MYNIAIRKAVDNDFTSIVSLLKEFAVFQKTPEKVKMSAEQMQNDKDLFHCLVAETGDYVIIGFVTFFPAYYSWSGKAIYVDDLFVKEEHRKHGTGKALLQSVIAIAKERGCTKVRWQVSAWNTNAIFFYESLGAVIDATESNCDLIL